MKGGGVLVSRGRREGWKIRESQIRRGFEISERADFDKLKRKGLFLYENQFYHETAPVFKLVVLWSIFLTFE